MESPQLALLRQIRKSAARYTGLWIMLMNLVFLMALLPPTFASETTKSLYRHKERQRIPLSLQRIENRGKLIVAMYHKDVKPFYFRDNNGLLTGVDVELMLGFARLLNVDVEFDRTASTFNEVINKVVHHQADIAISKLGITFSRAMKIRYTDPYIMLHQGLLVSRLALSRQSEGKDPIKAIKSLKGKIGVIANSSYVDNARERFRWLTVIGYPSWNKVIKATIEGQVTAAYRDEVEIKKIIRHQPDTAIKFISVVLKDAKDPKAMAVAWDDAYLQGLLNIYIKYLDLDLTANKVLDHYEKVVTKIRQKTTIKQNSW